MLLITDMGMIIVVQHIRRFEKDRSFVVKHSIAEWIRADRIKVINMEFIECGNDLISADVRYEVEK